MAPVSEAIQELWNFAVESEIVHDFEDFFVNFVDFVERNVIYPCTRTIFHNIFRAYVFVILSIPNFNFVLLLDNWNWYREQNECNVLFRYLTNEINYDLLNPCLVYFVRATTHSNRVSFALSVACHCVCLSLSILHYLFPRIQRSQRLPRSVRTSLLSFTYEGTIYENIASPPLLSSSEY